MKNYQKIAQTANWLFSVKPDFAELAWQRMEKAMESAPSGAGVDTGIRFLEDESKENRLVFAFGFHHMNENGIYDGWTEHKAIVTPSLAFGFDVRITGPDRNWIKEYLAETFHYWLDSEAKEEPTTIPSPINP
jgi:hypothetical protein